MCQFSRTGYDRCYTRIALSNGWCRCKADAHACMEEDLTTFYRKKCQSPVLCENLGIFLQIRLVFKATEVGYLLVIAISCSKIVYSSSVWIY